MCTCPGGMSTSCSRQMPQILCSRRLCSSELESGEVRFNEDGCHLSRLALPLSLTLSMSLGSGKGGVGGSIQKDSPAFLGDYWRLLSLELELELTRPWRSSSPAFREKVFHIRERSMLFSRQLTTRALTGRLDIPRYHCRDVGHSCEQPDMEHYPRTSAGTRPGRGGEHELTGVPTASSNPQQCLDSGWPVLVWLDDGPRCAG
ncbi:hypothetical protein BDV10DRAFT_109178 [Aspergillus recurvatus]